jgi:hypothetical protein
MSNNSKIIKKKTNIHLHHHLIYYQKPLQETSINLPASIYKVTNITLRSLAPYLPRIRNALGRIRSSGAGIIIGKQGIILFNILTKWNEFKLWENTPNKY